MSELIAHSAQRSCVGAAIQLLRKRRGLSARALSLSAGLSAAYVFKLEQGLVEPSVRTFGLLALALGMSPEEVWVCVLSEARCGSIIAASGDGSRIGAASAPVGATNT